MEKLIPLKRQRALIFTRNNILIDLPHSNESSELKKKIIISVIVIPEKICSWLSLFVHTCARLSIFLVFLRGTVVTGVVCVFEELLTFLDYHPSTMVCLCGSISHRLHVLLMHILFSR